MENWASGKIYKFFLSRYVFCSKLYAHGYECLTKSCKILYHLDNYRDAKNEDGINFKDKKLKIKWSTKKPIISKRDSSSGSFLDFIKNVGTL